MSKCSCCGKEMNEEEIKRFRKHKKHWQDCQKRILEEHIKKIQLKGGERQDDRKSKSSD